MIKPTVSAGSRDTARYRPGEEDRARAHLNGLLADGRTAMVQPYLDAVDDHGETGIAVLRRRVLARDSQGPDAAPGQPPSDGLYVQEEIRAREPDPLERAVAEEVLDSLPWPRRGLLYARVDLIRGPEGDPQLIELELTEPSLFFSYADGAAERLAGLIVLRL